MEAITETAETAATTRQERLDAIEIEGLMLALARARNRLQPAPTSWRVHDLMERMRRLMLAPR